MNKKNILFIVIMLSGAVVLSSALFFGQHSFASWIDVGDGIKYEQDDGRYARGFSDIDGERYYFDEDGYLITGKFYIEDEEAYYYANDNGIIQTGVIKKKKSFYVTDETGKIQTGFVDYDNNRYYFNERAELVTGWFQAGENWYYADDSGIIMTGFITLDGYRYYLNNEGIRVSDTVMEIDGVTYVFNIDGSIDENATTLYPVYQYFVKIRSENAMGDIWMNSRVQACAILRASDLINGYQNVEETDSSVETLLKNRGVKCSGGYEFSYGGVEGYGIDQLLSDMDRDLKLAEVLQKEAVTEVGFGLYEKNNVYYYDIIFIY